MTSIFYTVIIVRNRTDIKLLAGDILDKLKLKEQSKKLFEFHVEISGFYNEFAKSVGLTYASLKVLAIIYEEENCTQKTITQNTYLPKQTVNAIIKSLIKQNIISPLVESDTDKRNKVIKLTKEGKKFANEIILKAKEIEYRALDSIGEQKREALIEAVSLYKDNLKMII